jgi:hypothetical protein
MSRYFTFFTGTAAIEEKLRFQWRFDRRPPNEGEIKPRRLRHSTGSRSTTEDLRQIKANQSKSKRFVMDDLGRLIGNRFCKPLGESGIKVDQGKSRLIRVASGLSGDATGASDCAPFASRSGASLKMTLGRGRLRLAKAGKGGSKPVESRRRERTMGMIFQSDPSESG